MTQVNAMSGTGARLPDIQGHPGTYEIKHGDTLSRIAREHGVSVDTLLAANPQILNPDTIYAGQRLTIPGVPADAASSPAGSNAFDYDRIAGVRGNPNITAEFTRTVEQIAARLGTRPEYLMAVMSFETGGSFDPAQPNTAGSGATGLIQFMPATARGLGTSTAALARLSPVQQLDYVERYLLPFAGQLDTLEGVYSSVLAGHPVAEPSGTLFAAGSGAYRANAGLDANRDGRITSGEAAARVRERISNAVPDHHATPQPAAAARYLWR